ncbi:MAG: type 1 glutamine amidotransferase [Polyangiaceae bacterium]|jgi:GMP synthase (glutamine-hydrolysing)
MGAIHVLQHVPMEGPARIADVARELGFDVVVHSLSEGAPVPGALRGDDVLVVMGGPMGVGDIGDARWPFLEDEVQLVGRILREERPVLGICLGAQLMAHALGARVYPCHVGDPPVRHREVGWGAVTFTPPAGAEAVLEGANESEVVLHWHGDTFDLPRAATRLASTLACENQMFRYGRRSYALQFHVEVTADDVKRWTREDAAFVLAANGPGGAERIVADTDRYMPRHRQVGDRLIRNILAATHG